MSSELKIERWVERQFWQEVRAGRSVVAAADAVGVSDSAGKRWFRNGGGMPTLPLAEPSARFLSMAEREEIAARAGRMSIRQIAWELGRSPSTISRELARGAPGGLAARYRPSAAQRRAEERARRPKASKLASDSDMAYPILVEIETPHSRWWHSSGEELHSDFSHAQGQLAEWRAWFHRGRNLAAFADYYELPPFFRNRRIVPRFVLVHGRRGETGENPARLAKRAELRREDERLMTFDRLIPDPRIAEFLSVTHSARGYELLRVPQAFRVIDWDDHRFAAIGGWKSALAETPDLSEARADFVEQEISGLIAQHRRGLDLGPRKANPR
jgi:transposase